MSLLMESSPSSLMQYSDVIESLLARVPQHVKTMVPYQPGKPLDELKAEFGFDQVIKLASNENPFGVSPKAIAAMQEALAGCYRYGDPISRRLRQGLAEQLGVDIHELGIVSGSENLLAILSRAFMQMGDLAVQGQGAFLGFEIHAQAIGGKVLSLTSPGYRFDVPALIDACTKIQPKILYLPNPNNPTGTYINKTDMQLILDQCPKSTLIVVDEAYCEFCADIEDYPDMVQMRQDNVFVCRTFSKAHGLAGLRVAYGIGHPKLVEQVMKVKMTFEPSTLAQVAALASLEDQAFLDKVIANNKTEKQRYYEFFERHQVSYVPSVGNFVMVVFSNQAQVDLINQQLLRKGIAIRPLASFGYPNCMRISIGLPEENQALLEALEALLPMVAPLA